MGTYIVTATAHRDVEFKGNEMVKSERYVYGDKIEYNDAKAERLLRTGGLMTVEDFEAHQKAKKDLAEAVQGAALDPVDSTPGDGAPSEGEITGGASFSQGVPENTDGPSAGSGTPGSAEVTDGATAGSDEYSGMDYPALQQAAKDAGVSAGGSKEDIRARLRSSDSE